MSHHHHREFAPGLAIAGVLSAAIVGWTIGTLFATQPAKFGAMLAIILVTISNGLLAWLETGLPFVLRWTMFAAA